MSEKQECCHGRYKNHSWNEYACSRTATVEKDGKWYCWQHNPEYEAKKNKELREKWDREAAERTKRWADEAERKRLLDESGVARLDVFELRWIIAAGGIHAIMAASGIKVAREQVETPR
jgi:hypothetical protein